MIADYVTPRAVIRHDVFRLREDIHREIRHRRNVNVQAISERLVLVIGSREAEVRSDGLHECLELVRGRGVAYLLFSQAASTVGGLTASTAVILV